ncbi:MAG: hypothetical protein AAF547_06505 [Actinomycetota bacterium]
MTSLSDRTVFAALTTVETIRIVLDKLITDETEKLLADVPADEHHALADLIVELRTNTDSAIDRAAFGYRQWAHRALSPGSPERRLPFVSGPSSITIDPTETTVLPRNVLEGIWLLPDADEPQGESE